MCELRWPATAAASVVQTEPRFGSFVVRLRADTRGEWRGRLEHCQTGTADNFSSREELLRLMERYLGIARRPAPP